MHTSLLDDVEYSKDDLPPLFRSCWQAELNLRRLKKIMQMKYVRCKKPQRVGNELRVHWLAYNTYKPREART